MNCSCRSKGHPRWCLSFLVMSKIHMLRLHIKWISSFMLKYSGGGIFLPISTLPLERNPLLPVSLPLVKLFDVEMCWNLPPDCLCSAGFFGSQGNFISHDGGRQIILATEFVIDSGFSIRLRPAYPLPRLRAPCPLLCGWTQAACPFALSLPLLSWGGGCS